MHYGDFLSSSSQHDYLLLVVLIVLVVLVSKNAVSLCPLDLVCLSVRAEEMTEKDESR